MGNVRAVGHVQNPVENTVKGEGRVRLRNRSKLRKIDLKEGVFRGMPVYICTIFVLLAVLFLSVLYAVTVGSADLSMKDVYQVIFYEIFKVGDPEVWGSGAIHDIVWVIRFPRIVLGIAVGMGLAVVGVVMQAIVKNPLADPYILGISSGASLGATLTILLGSVGVMQGAGIGIGAFVGAIVVSFAVIAISGIGGRITSVKLILSGVALSSICSAFSNFIVYVADDAERFKTVSFWLMGSLAGAKWTDSIRVLIIVIVAVLFFVTQSRMLKSDADGRRYGNYTWHKPAALPEAVSDCGIADDWFYCVSVRSDRICRSDHSTFCPWTVRRRSQKAAAALCTVRRDFPRVGGCGIKNDPASDRDPDRNFDFCGGRAHLYYPADSENVQFRGWK